MHHVLGAQVRHDCRENRGQQHLARLQTGLRRGDAISRESNDVALALVVIEKDLFAAHAAQDAKSGDGVGAERRQTSGRFALGGLGGVQRLHQWCRERRQDRHTDEDNESQFDRGREENERNDDPGGDRAHEAREHVVRATDAHGVRGHRVDNVAGRDLVSHGGAGLRDVVANDLNGFVGGVHPVGHGQLVTQCAADRLEETERHDDADPQEEFALVLGDDAVVDRGADGRPDQCLTHHPADTEEGVEGQVDLLLRGDPDQIAQRRTRIGCAGFRGRQLAVGQV